MAGEGEFPKGAGDIAYASEANYFARPIMEVYVGTGFDVAHSGVGTTTEDHEFNVVSASDLLGSKYIEIRALFSILQDASASTRINTVKIEKKHVGGSYEEILPEIIVADSQSDDTVEGELLLVLPFIYEMDADDLTNGIQIKLTATGAGNGVASKANLTNVQTVVRVI